MFVSDYVLTALTVENCGFKKSFAKGYSEHVMNAKWGQIIVRKLLKSIKNQILNRASRKLCSVLSLLIENWMHLK